MINGLLVQHSSGGRPRNSRCQEISHWNLTVETPYATVTTKSNEKKPFLLGEFSSQTGAFYTGCTVCLGTSFLWTCKQISWGAVHIPTSSEVIPSIYTAVFRWHPSWVRKANGKLYSESTEIRTHQPVSIPVHIKDKWLNSLATAVQHHCKMYCIRTSTIYNVDELHVCTMYLFQVSLKQVCSHLWVWLDGLWTKRRKLQGTKYNNSCSCALR